MPCLTEQTVLGKHVGTEACCSHPSLPKAPTGLVTECRLSLPPHQELMVCKNTQTPELHPCSRECYNLEPDFAP